nr:MAG TPA: hypothetical protein [Caudoviricetes sp.]DAT73954.1 MAG TPA: hypothetical protein [Caudoviricetes sp.]
MRSATNRSENLSIQTYLPKTYILYHKNPLTGTNDANCVINSKNF